MFHLAPHSILNTSTSSLSPASPVLLSSSSPTQGLLSTHPFIHCKDPRRDGTSTEFHSSTGYEPKWIELNRILVYPQNQIIDQQPIIDTFSLRFGLEDEHLRKMQASPLNMPKREENEGPARAYQSERESLMIISPQNPEVSGRPDAECVQKREANAQQTQAYHSKRESLITSSRDLEVSGKPDAVLSGHSESSQNTFSERDRSNEPGNRFETSVRSVF